MTCDYHTEYGTCLPLRQFSDATPPRHPRMGWRSSRLLQWLSIPGTWYAALAACALLFLGRQWLLSVVEVASTGFSGASTLSLSLVISTPLIFFFLQPVAKWFVYIYFVYFVPAFVIRPPLHRLVDATTMRITVWPWLCDPNMHLTNSVYSAFADLAWFVHMHRFGYFKIFLGEGVSPVVGSQIMRFRAELPTLSTATIETRLQGWDSKYFYFEFLFKRGGRAAFVMLRKVMLIDTRAKKDDRKLTPKAALERIARTITWDHKKRDEMLAEIEAGKEPSEAMQKLLQSSDALLSPD
jgi:acyl-CoA thioesterase FadM